EALANAAKDLTSAFFQLFSVVEPQSSPTLTRRVMDLIFKFAGEPLPETALDAIMDEAGFIVTRDEEPKKEVEDQASSNGQFSHLDTEGDAVWNQSV
ncbi:MAG TPA: hypothetical protein VFI27_16515, partial [candidate division Zixibacteria bacterium]|nr:hypothetical protein [candidate division Zixibacteria bacterium]